MSETVDKNNLQGSDNNKTGKGLRILGIIIICFSLFIICVPLIHILKSGFKAQYSPILIIGTIILVLGIGLTLKHYWAWLCSVILFSLLILNNIIDLVRTQRSTAISNLFLLIIAMVVLNNCRNQVIRKKSNISSKST